VSTASGPSLVIMSTTRRIAEELRANGEFDMFECTIKRVDAQHLFAARSSSGDER
jgi:hypothetical protein